MDYDYDGWGHPNEEHDECMRLCPASSTITQPPCIRQSPTYKDRLVFRPGAGTEILFFCI